MQTGPSRFAGAAEVAVSGGGADPPELVPALSRGRHRSPRQGACLMELASYLAGERWSAHPACTHPLLAALTRDVNDHTSDAGLTPLAVLAPSVIGLTGDDPRLDARIALVCARMALPVAAAGRQQIMAVSVLACERMLADLDGRPTGSLEEQSRAVLAQFRTPRSGPATSPPAGSPAPSRPPRRPSASARHRSSSMPRWRGSRRRISRSRTRCSVTCSSARSPSAPRRDTAITAAACASPAQPPSADARPARQPSTNGHQRPVRSSAHCRRSGRVLASRAWSVGERRWSRSAR